MTTENPYEFDATEVEARPRRAAPVWLWLLGLGCLLPVVLCVGLATLGGVTAYNTGRKELTPVVEEFLTLGEAGRADEAWELVSSAWREQGTVDDLRTLFEHNVEVLGERESLGTPSVNIHWGPGGDHAEVVYPARYANGPVTVTVSLVEDEDEERWMVQGIDFSSDLFLGRFVCEACGHDNDGRMVRFCGNCGERIGGSRASTEETESTTQER